MIPLTQPRVETPLLSIQAIPAWIVIASFGPYVLINLGLRTDHLMIYGLAPLAFGRLLFSGGSLAMRPALLATWGMWFGIVVWMLAVTAFGPGEYGSLKKVIAFTENYFQPIAVVIAVSTIAIYRTAEEVLGVLRLTCKMLIAMLVLNAAFAGAASLTDLSGIAFHFVGEPDRDNTVWDIMDSMGRHTGIFAAGMSAGIIYSAGLMAWVWLYSSRRVIPILGLLVFGVIVAGGFLALSRAFMFVGLPLSLVYLVVVRGWSEFTRWRSVLLAAICIAAVVWKIENWLGIVKLEEYFRRANFDSVQTFLAVYTSNRYMVSSIDGSGLPKSIMDIPFFTGNGLDSFRGIWGSIDNGLLEFYYQGGAVALAMYLIILVVMLYTACRAISGGYDAGWLLLFLFILVSIGTLAGPVLTANRVGPVLMTLMTLIYSYVDLKQRDLKRATAARAIHAAVPAE